MAEFVQQRIEEMVGELNHLQNVGLFDTAEIREIVRKRKALEYKLRRKTKEKQDFLLYIKYEMNVLALIKKRRKTNKCMVSVKDIEVPIVKRIHKLFNLVCLRFKDDIKLWLSHIEFCKQKGEKKFVSRLFTSLLKIHPHKTDLWVLAAKHEMEHRQSMASARALLQQGINTNPESQHLWLQYFQMELLNAESLRLKVDELKDDQLKAEESNVLVLGGEAAKIVFSNACLQFPDDVQLRLSFLDIACRFNFTEVIQDVIYTELESRFTRSEVARSAIAKRPLHRAVALYADYRGHKDEIREFEEETYRLFDSAVVLLPTVSMWSQYLETCVEILQRPLSKKHSQRNVQHALSTFDRAANSQQLSEQMALSWLTLLTKTGQVAEAQSISEKLVAQFGSSVELWMRRISIVMTTAADPATVLSCIDASLTACLALKDESAVDLWQMALSWCLTNSTQQVGRLCERGLLATCPAVGLYIKQFYIDFTATHGDIHAVRNLYLRLVAAQPTSASLVQSYVDIELSQGKPKMKHVRRAYEEALLAFGSKHIDIWLNYIRAELTSPSGKPQNVAGLSWRAEKDLQELLVDEFKQQFSELTNSVTVTS